MRTKRSNGAPFVPAAPEAERAVLSLCFFKPELAGRYLSQLRPDLFHDLRHRAAFLALKSTLEDGAPVDEAAVIQRADRAVVSPLDLAQIVDFKENPAGFDGHLDLLRRKAAGREAMEMAEATIGRLQAGEDEESVLADFKDIAERRLELATHAARLPDIDDASALVANPPETPAELVGGILHRGSKLVVGGSSKANKTWLLVDLALSVATGGPWLRHPTHRGHVLFVNLEVQGCFFARRLKAVSEAKHATVKPGTLDVWNLRGFCADYATLLPKIGQRIKDMGYVLVVLDPIYKLLGGADENAAGDIGRIMAELERLAVRTGAAVAFSGHFAKGNASSKESIDRISGSGVFARDPDSIITLTRHEEEDAFTVEATLRNFQPVQPFVVKWLFPLMRRDDNLDPARLRQPKTGRTAIYKPEVLLEHLTKKGLSSTEWQKRVAAETGMSRGKFFELLAQIRTSKHATNTEGIWKSSKSNK